MRHYVLLSWLCLTTLLAQGQKANYREQYEALMRQQKTKEAAAVVAKWEKAASQDPDLYVAKFNIILSGADALVLSSNPNAPGEGFQITDPKNGKEVGSIWGGGYNPLKVQQAIEVLRKGLALAPDRLDIRFGLAKAAEMKEDAAQQYQLLREALAWRASAAGKPWRWRNGGALPAPEAQFVPSTLEGYMVPYWQSGTVEGREQALKLTELLIQYYPQSSLGYFNKGNYYAFSEQDAEAYKWFEKADQLNPDDPQNVNNLLRISLNLKDKAAVQRYLPRLCRYPDFEKECQSYTAELKKL